MGVIQERARKHSYLHPIRLAMRACLASRNSYAASYRCDRLWVHDRIMEAEHHIARLEVDQALYTRAHLRERLR